jgi:hypothetical protein
VQDWDDDIASMSLTDVEKNGLQIYRNYQRAFANHAEKELASKIDAEQFDFGPLERVVRLVAHEEPRFVPVIACAYADDLLKAMFKANTRDGVPGGKAKLFGPYGPFSDLFRRLQMAFLFDMISPDLVADFDRLREARNSLSHTWDIETLDGFFTRGRVNDIFPIESLLGTRLDWFPTDTDTLEPLCSFRVRVVWLVSRLTYEAPLYARARGLGLQPAKALFGPNCPKRLGEISRIAMTTCREVVPLT